MNFYRFFPEKYRLATRHLTAFQDGCYRRLIDEYMETRRPLPDDDVALAGICRISLDEWNNLAAAKLRLFFRQKDGLLFQENCDAELDWQDGKSKIATEKGKKGALIRHSKNKDLLSTGIAQAKLGDARVKSKEITSEDVIPPLPPKKKIDEEFENHFKNFWEPYPKKRAGSKSKAKAAYAKAIKLSPPEEINEAVKRYAASDEVARGYAKGAAAWLNDDRWKTDYSTSPRGGNGKAGAGKAPVSFTGIAAELAQAGKSQGNL